MVKQRMSSVDVAAEVACLRQRVVGLKVANIYDLDAKVGSPERSMGHIRSLVEQLHHHACPCARWGEEACSGAGGLAEPASGPQLLPAVPSCSPAFFNRSTHLLQTYVLKLSKSGGDGDKVFLLLESGARLHTTEVGVCSPP